ncbi:hypothetical protein BB8028_0009g01780 [Beauveria bassiana]|uniref:Uncharacterized protein n=1 Tax=Beauveria bassiana TaxID=176275 RepID=A0A2S7YP65_BEABA|nr:hypothetical protein BB8028_0009g01780 [Beauveria bassiana]
MSDQTIIYTKDAPALSGHQDPICHLLLRRHSPQGRRQLCRHQHHRPDHSMLRQPQGRPHRGRLFHFQGRQDHDLHLRHGPLRRDEHRVRETLFPQTRSQLRRRQDSPQGRRRRD